MTHDHEEQRQDNNCTKHHGAGVHSLVGRSTKVGEYGVEQGEDVGKAGES